MADEDKDGFNCDTDDTDALLNCNPSGFPDEEEDPVRLPKNMQDLASINSFIGMSVTQMAQRIEGLIHQSQLTSKETSSKDDSDAFNSSDFFDSKGQLQLDGLDQFSVSESEPEDDAEAKSESGESSVSTSSIEASMEEEIKMKIKTKTKVQNGNPPNPGGLVSVVSGSIGDCTQFLEKLSLSESLHRETGQQKDNGHVENEDDVIEVMGNPITNPLADNKKDSSLLFVSENRNRFRDVLRNPNPASLPSRPRPIPQKRSHNHSTHSNDKARREEYLKHGWKAPPNADPFVAIRAPNFRTRGGYKPPENPKPPRELTEQQILDEVRRMYSNPTGFSGSDDDGDVAIQNERRKKKDRAKVVSFNVPGTEDEEAKSQGRRDEVTDKPVMKSAIKKSGETIGSIPDLGLGVRDLLSTEVEVEEPSVVAVSKWLCGQDGEQEKEQKTWKFQNRNGPHPVNGELQLSPIRKSLISEFEEEKVLSDQESSNEPNFPSPVKIEVLQLNQLWRDIQNASSRMEHDFLKTTENICGTEGTGKLPGFILTEKPEASLSSHSSQGKVTNTTNESIDLLNARRRKNRERMRRKAAIRQPLDGDCEINKDRLIDPGEGQTGNSHGLIYSLPSGIKPLSNSPLKSNEFPVTKSEIRGIASYFPEDSDLESILKDVDIDPIELDQFLENFEVADEMYNEDPETLAAAFSQVKISEWARSGAGEYLQKYHEERCRRERCETEIARIQKELLEIKETAAVLEESVKRKDTMLIKNSVSWAQLTKEWKSHEGVSKATVLKLQKDQCAMLAAIKASNDQIAKYEKELTNALDLAESYRSRFTAMEAQQHSMVEDKEVELVMIQNAYESEKMEKQVALEKRDETLETLAQAMKQTELDRKKVFQLEEQVQDAQKDAFDAFQRCESLVQHNISLEKQLAEFTNTKSVLEGELARIRIQLEDSENSLQNLRIEHEKLMHDQTEKLHSYYSGEVKALLGEVSTQATAAEETLKENLRKTTIENERRLSECRARYRAELDRQKMKYETELITVRREMAQKQALINTTAQQLQRGEVVPITMCPGPGGDRLQTVVSNLPAAGRSAILESATNSRNVGDTLSKLLGATGLVHRSTSDPLPLYDPPVTSHFNSTSDITTEMNEFPPGRYYNTKLNIPRFEYSGGGQRERVKEAKLVNSCVSTLSQPFTLTAEKPTRLIKVRGTRKGKGHGKGASTSKPNQTSDPGLTKCLETLVKCYAQKLEQLERAPHSSLVNCTTTNSNSNTTSSSSDNANSSSTHNVNSDNVTNNDEPNSKGNRNNLKPPWK